MKEFFKTGISTFQKFQKIPMSSVDAKQIQPKLSMKIITHTGKILNNITQNKLEGKHYIYYNLKY